MPTVDSDCLVVSPCLLRAIEEHKYLRSCESGYEVDFLDAAREFQANHEYGWRVAKVRADNAQQIQEMRKHLWIESQKAGRDVGHTTAGTDWVTRYAAAWRRQRESLHANDFVEAELVISDRFESPDLCLDVLAQTAERYYADVFVSQESVTQPHFRMQPHEGAPRRPYLLAETSRRADLSQLGATPGARLHLVAYGRDAAPALAAIREALE